MKYCQLQPKYCQKFVAVGSSRPWQCRLILGAHCHEPVAVTPASYTPSDLRKQAVGA